jgi:hypothetical protein
VVKLDSSYMPGKQLIAIISSTGGNSKLWLSTVDEMPGNFRLKDILELVL